LSKSWAEISDPRAGVTPGSKLLKSLKKSNLVGGFNPSETYESQLGLLFPIYVEKHVPNHQPVIRLGGAKHAR